MQILTALLQAEEKDEAKAGGTALKKVDQRLST
jgi:hypothetical protein